MNEQLEKYFAPMHELNVLAIQNLEKLVDIQLSYLEDSTRAGVEQLKTAAAINDAEGLKNYINTQVETSRKFTERAIEDSRTVAEIGTGYATEVQKVIKEAFKRDVDEFKREVDKVKPEASAFKQEASEFKQDAGSFKRELQNKKKS
jgi:phasin family protein